MIHKKKISKKTISRALLYTRTLEELLKNDILRVSSAELADLTGVSDVQIRKDISNFGKVGTPRVGYKVADLKNTLENFVLHHKVLKIAVFGAGNLGTAIIGYSGFGKGKIKIVAAFDIDKKKINRNINGVKVYDIRKTKEVVKKVGVDLGVIAVPAEHSQHVAELMANAGIKAMVNFSPVSISVPDDVFINDLDLSLEFLSIYCETRLQRV